MTKLENATQIMGLLEVFYVEKPQNIPEKVKQVIQYLDEGYLWAVRNTPEPYEKDYRVSVEILSRLRSCFEKCLDLPPRGMILVDEKEGFKVNIFPVLDFLAHLEKEGTACRNFDVIANVMCLYLHSDNIQQYKDLSNFIRLMETALYEYV